MIANVKKIGLVRIIVNRHFEEKVRLMSDMDFENLFDFPVRYEGCDAENLYYVMEVPLNDLDDAYKDAVSTINFWVKEYKCEQEKHESKEDFRIWE